VNGIRQRWQVEKYVLHTFGFDAFGEDIGSPPESHYVPPCLCQSESMSSKGMCKLSIPNNSSSFFIPANAAGELGRTPETRILPFFCSTKNPGGSGTELRDDNR
jgi:hypothetical protein